MKQMQELVSITHSLYLKEQAAVQDILSEEAVLRAKLAQLDLQVRQARNENSGFEPMQAIGADVVWLSWVGRAKTQLNLQLAQVLARKSQVMGKVSLAFGKSLIARQMAVAEEKKQRDKRQARLLASAYDANVEK